MRPLVLLDVDGVLNAVGPADEAWPDWERGRATAGGRQWPLRWSPSVVRAVLGWQGRADVQWLTTWGHDANRGLHALLGLPELVVAGTHQDAGDEGSADPADALAAVTPAAPDALSGRWWKFDVVRRLLRAQPGRPLVWLDDDLARSAEVRAWTQDATRCLLVAPDPRTGLVRAHLDAVERFLQQQDGGQGTPDEPQGT